MPDIFQTVKYICNDWVPSPRRYISQIQVLHLATIQHTARRVNLHSVIKHIYMNFTPQFQIVPMNQCIHDSLKDSRIRIIRHLNPSVSCLSPCFLRISGNKTHAVLQKIYQTATVFFIINMTAYIRLGNESVPADNITLKRLVLQGTNRSYDSLVSNYKFNSIYQAWCLVQPIPSRTKNSRMTNGRLIRQQCPCICKIPLFVYI